ncbi:hypothetical protein ACROYT_G044084 [Oculina patagonica]
MGYPFKLPPGVACFARLVIYRPPPAVSGKASAPLPLLVSSQCLLGDIAVCFPEGVPNPTPLRLLIWMLILSCSVVVHSFSFVMTTGQWMPMIDLRHLLIKVCSLAEFPLLLSTFQSRKGGLTLRWYATSPNFTTDPCEMFKFLFPSQIEELKSKDQTLHVRIFFSDSGGAPWSPLHIAVRQGHLDCVKLLIRAGADVNSVNAGKHTPLHEAAYRGFDDIILELLLRGADPHAASNQKRTPLHEACIQGKVKAAVMLLDVNSKVNGTDLVRDTPLHLTLRADHAFDIAVQLTTILLQYGASPTLLGRDDDMPLDIARLSGQTYCLELLQMALEMPQPLTHICKVLLRKQLACHWNDIEELPLPSKLKCFLVNEV